MVRQHVRGRVVTLPSLSKAANANAFGDLPPSLGLAASSTCDEDWPLRNLISSVGKPPVWTFCGIILLFGLILGPGLLILTGWIGRRSLLILLVPLVSLGATLAIVAYEVLHEGFGTYARTTAVIEIDEQSGEAFVWSRQTYFSGWPSREGLAVPSNVFFRPVTSFTDRSRQFRNHPVNQYKVEYQPGQSVWTGVLPSREQKQFLLGHSLKGKMPIDVQRTGDKQASLKNLTNETLPVVLLRDDQGNFYLAEDLAPDTTIELTGEPFDDISGTLSRIRSKYQPSAPAEMRSLGWAFMSNQSNTEVLDVVWSGALSEQSVTSTIRPFGFVTLMQKNDDIFMPYKTSQNESLILVTGRALW